MVIPFVFQKNEKWKQQSEWMGGWEIIIEYKHDTKNVQVSQVLGTGVPQCGNFM